MATQRPTSEQYNLQPQQKSGSNPQYRMSADLSHLGGQQTASHRGSRPTSEIFPTNNHNSYQSPEAEAIDKWFEDLQHYEQTLEEMATASLDETFKEELKAIEQWFRVLSEAERTAALFSLLQHSTQVQIRFFITVLQQMARNDPMGALLSPANPEKDLMQAQLSGAMSKVEVDAKLAAMSLKSPTSQTYQRRLYDRHSGVDFLSPEAAIYTDPAVALAQKRARLQANTGNRSAGLYQTRPKSMVSETDSNLWNSSTVQTPTTGNSVSANNNNNNNNHNNNNNSNNSSNNNNNNNNNNDRTTNGRPKSADLSAIPWTPGFPLRSPRPGAFDGELSPLVGGSWASMVPTPVVPMFAENKSNKQAADAELVNKKLTSWNLSNSSGNRIVLESDVKKFRRNQGKNSNSGVPATVQEEKYNHHNHNHNHNIHHNNNNHNHNHNNNNNNNNNLGANIVLSMYDAEGNLRSPQQSPILSPKIVGSRQGSRPPSPNHHHNNQYQAHHGGWSTSSGKGGGGTHLVPPPNNVSRNSGDDNSGGGGYHSDQSDASYNAGKGHSKGHGKNKKKQTDDTVDFNLLEDIPAWLRSLRLHKYTPLFEGMKWQDIIELNDSELETKGVAALGARRKMLKEFDKVKDAMKDNGLAEKASS